MTRETIRFLGGPADGDWREVENVGDYYEIPYGPAMKVGAYEKELANIALNMRYDLYRRSVLDKHLFVWQGNRGN